MTYSNTAIWVKCPVRMHIYLSVPKNYDLIIVLLLHKLNGLIQCSICTLSCYDIKINAENLIHMKIKMKAEKLTLKDPQMSLIYNEENKKGGIKIKNRADSVLIQTKQVESVNFTFSQLESQVIWRKKLYRWLWWTCLHTTCWLLVSKEKVYKVLK